MKKLLLLLAIASGNGVAAQETHKAPAGRWQIGAVVSPDYSYRTLVVSGGGAPIEDLKTRRDAAEEGQAAFTAGLVARRYFSRHFGLSAGLQLAQRRYSSDRTTNGVIEDQFDPGTGTATGETIRLRTWDRLSYLEIPLGLSYRSNEGGRLAFTATAGLSVNFLVNSRQHYVIESPTLHRTGDEGVRNVNTFGLSAFAGAGMEWRASPQLSFSAAPVFRYGLLPVAEGPLKGHLWAAGLQLGAYWSL